MEDMKKIVGKIAMFLFVIGIALSGFTGNVYADSSNSGNMSATENENRLWGEDRIETSLKISQEGWKYGAATAVIAQGYGYADALCAAPLAKKYNAPIILSRQDSLDDETIKELKRLEVDRAFVIGGTGSLSDNVESQLKDIGVSTVKRLGGQDRYETSVKIAEELENVSNIVVASGSGYADSLSIASIAAKKGMPILLSQSDALPQAVKNYLKNRNIEKTYIVGGTGVISSDLESSFTNAVRLGGATRFDTNLAVLQNFKSDLNFSNVYVARGNGPNGDEFADALSGSALAATESAPVVLTDNTVASKTADFLKENMSDKTVITALGGTAVVPAVILDDLVRYFNGESTSGGIGDETKPGTGGGTSANSGTFTLEITKDNNGTILEEKTLNVEEDKVALDYLKTVVDKVDIKSSYINSMSVNGQDYVNESAQDLSHGTSWFIYVNNEFAQVGVQAIEPKSGDVIRFDYHDWTYDNPGGTGSGSSGGSGGGSNNPPKQDTQLTTLNGDENQGLNLLITEKVDG
ncbi:cell wall-binding repeat-containing protein [Clostridium sp. MT-14]|uniref:cell wall-binding repeat-containing protein n=1 Tax=Clostridium sp. MT-14 TaxID=3348360 RepID=UPI0035F4C50A